MCIFSKNTRTLNILLTNLDYQLLCYSGVTRLDCAGDFLEISFWMYFGLKLFWLMNLLFMFKKWLCAKGFMIATTGDKSRQADKLLALDSQGGFDL